MTHPHGKWIWVPLKAPSWRQTGLLHLCSVWRNVTPLTCDRRWKLADRLSDGSVRRGFGVMTVLGTTRLSSGENTCHMESYNNDLAPTPCTHAKYNTHHRAEHLKQAGHFIVTSSIPERREVSIKTHRFHREFFLHTEALCSVEEAVRHWLKRLVTMRTPACCWGDYPKVLPG